MIPRMERTTDCCRPLTLSEMARHLRVPVGWLRTEAEAGRVPSLAAGRVLLFDAVTVERLLSARAAGDAGRPPGVGPGHRPPA